MLIGGVDMSIVPVSKKKPNTTYFFLFMGLILYRYIMYTQKKGGLIGKDKT